MVVDPSSENGQQRCSECDVDRAVDSPDIAEFASDGMGTTMMNIGVLLGIRSMFTVLGDGRAPTDFAAVFAFGAAVAALSVVGALVVRPARTASPQGG